MINDYYNEYKIIQFAKKNISLINLLKKYSKRNCRDELDIAYVTSSLQKVDIGFSFFEKNIPIAFICSDVVNDKKLHISIICSIKNNNNLGSRLLNKLFEYAKNNHYKIITLECDDKLENFYKKFGFFVSQRLELDFISMHKIID